MGFYEESILEASILESFTFACIFKVACWGEHFIGPKVFISQNKILNFLYLFHLLWLKYSFVSAAVLFFCTSTISVLVFKM